MILNTGDVPNIYESDEKAEITEQVAFDFQLGFWTVFKEKLDICCHERPGNCQKWVFSIL